MSITVDVKVTITDNVYGGWFVVDKDDVALHNGEGEAQISDDFPDHSYQFWFEGEPSAEFDFELSISGHQIAKGKSVVPAGKHFNYGTGEFKLPH